MKAMQFAIDAHKEQKRKYTFEPYWKHLAEVAGIVSQVSTSNWLMVEIAWLHDYIEDCDKHLTTEQKYDLLFDEFGVTVADGVMLLTDTEVGNRATRKMAAANRIARAPWYVQNVKLADILSNTISIVQHDPKFSVIYLNEVEYLLSKMCENTHAKFSPDLFSLVALQIKAARKGVINGKTKEGNKPV